MTRFVQRILCIRHPLVVVEGKWQADLGDKQGRPPIHTQLEMRAMQVRAGTGSTGVVVIALPPDLYEHATKGVFGRYFSPDGEGYQLRDAARELGVPLRVLTWRDVLARLDGHPLADELAAYLLWRLEHARG